MRFSIQTFSFPVLTARLIPLLLASIPALAQDSVKAPVEEAPSAKEAVSKFEEVKKAVKGPRVRPMLNLACLNESVEEVELNPRFPVTGIYGGSTCGEDFQWVFLPEGESIVILNEYLPLNEFKERKGPLGRGAFGEVGLGLFIDKAGVVTASAIKSENGQKKASMLKGDDVGNKKKYLEKALEHFESEMGLQSALSTEPEFLRRLGGGVYVKGKDPSLLDFNAYSAMELVTPLSDPKMAQAFSRRSAGKNKKPLKGLRTVAKNILQAISKMESRGIVHRDIKPDNLFIDANGQVKLGDFGLATKELPSLGQMNGTANFLPDIFHEMLQTSKTDVYSLGMSLYNMYYGKFPALAQQAPQEFVFPDVEGNPLEKSMQDFLKLLLDRDPKTRSSAADLLKLPYMAEAKDLLPAKSVVAPLTIRNTPIGLRKRLKKVMKCLNEQKGEALNVRNISRQIPD